MKNCMQRSVSEISFFGIFFLVNDLGFSMSVFIFDVLRFYYIDDVLLVGKLEFLVVLVDVLLVNFYLIKLRGLFIK